MSGIVAVCLFLWEVEYQMLVPLLPQELLVHFSPQEMLNPPTLGAAHMLHRILIPRFVLHLILFVFLLAATLTDFYEMIIPDTIPVVGTLTALFMAALFFHSALPIMEMGLTKGGTLVPDGTMFYTIFPMHLWSPNPAGSCSRITMTLLWWFWCFTMLDRVWYTQLPFRKAGAIFCRYLYRSPRTKYIAAAAVIVPLCLIGLVHEQSEVVLFSALTGMASGMILIWAIRLVSRYVLGIEAMGFGDVTLMGMIGAFLGWQPVLLIFFIAPFFGLVYGIIHWILGRGRAVPYGPFLCLATVVVVIAWRFIWAATAEFFAFGIGVIGGVMFLLLFLFAGLLYLVHKIMSRLRL
jgi:prepilin signal peptidase PulO-like enzyme (type II secretory pathway)